MIWVRLAGVKQLLWVGLGGFCGSILRYQIGLGLTRFSGAFPLATLTINLTGCFLIGILAALGEKRGILTSETRLFLMTGFLGGFTTFSTFGLETFALLRAAKPGLALLYIGLSVSGGVLMVALGWQIVQWWPRVRQN